MFVAVVDSWEAPLSQTTHKARCPPDTIGIFLPLKRTKPKLIYYCITVSVNYVQWIKICRLPASEINVLKVKWLMPFSLQIVAHGDWPGWSYSTTREKQFQGKSGPTCSSHTTTHAVPCILVKGVERERKWIQEKKCVTTLAKNRIITIKIYWLTKLAPFNFFMPSSGETAVTAPP